MTTPSTDSTVMNGLKGENPVSSFAIKADEAANEREMQI